MGFSKAGGKNLETRFELGSDARLLEARQKRVTLFIDRGGRALTVRKRGVEAAMTDDKREHGLHDVARGSGPEDGGRERAEGRFEQIERLPLFPTPFGFRFGSSAVV